MRSVPWCSLRGRSGARHPLHARYRALRVAPGGSAPLFPSAPRHGTGLSGRDGKTAPRPNQKTAMTEAWTNAEASSGSTAKRYVTKLRPEIPWTRHDFHDRSGQNSSAARRRDKTPPRECGSARLSGRLGSAHAACFSAPTWAGSNSVRVRNIAQATASSRSATVRNARPCE